MARISRSVIAFMAIQMITAVTTQEMEKRGPQGFLGMRGKKYEDGPDQFYKKKPQFFVGVKGKKDLVDMNDLIEPDYFKRAPMGFMGMRGKKDVFDGKRAPMGFVGMRGKKDLFEDKRAPMGFVGMRGKKDEFDDTRGSLIGQIEYAANTDNDFPLLNEVLTEYLNRLGEPNSESEERITNEVEKRAARQQFYGVRGKKSLQSKRPYDVSFRGKFIGVRGKKDVPPQEINFLLDQGAMPKRKGAMGFIGMRGKKWDDDSSPESDTLI